jgi:hypothetical protein
MMERERSFVAVGNSVDEDLHMTGSRARRLDLEEQAHTWYGKLRDQIC